MAQPSSTALPGSGDAEPRAVVGGAATPDEGLPLPRTKLLKNLSARHGVPGRERTRTQSSAFSVSPRPDSPQAAPAMSMPFSAGALSLPASSGASLLVAPEAAGASDVLLPVRKPRSRTRVSGHPTQLMTDPASLFQRGVPASERDPAKLGTLGHRTSVAAPTRFVPLNQALATTDGGGRILTANDTLCRILGYNQSEVTGADVLDFLGAPYRERQRKFLMERENEGGDSEAVLVSGNVVQIMKKDARTAPASLWLKEKRTMSGTRILMWVFEPILENSVTVTILKDGKIVDVSGTCDELFGYSEEELKLRKFWDLVPSLRPFSTVHTVIPHSSPNSSSPGTPSPASGGPFEIDQINRHKFFGAVTRQGITIPIIAKSADDESDNEDDLDGLAEDEEHAEDPRRPFSLSSSAAHSPLLQTYPIQIISMPNIAGVMTLRADGVIASCNTMFAKYLFGISSRELVDRVNVTTLIPQFWTLVQQIGNENLRQGSVAASFSPLNTPPPEGFPESPVQGPSPLGTIPVGQVAGEALVRTSGVIAYHRDGTPFNVDLQIRVSAAPDTDTPYMLSITYDRYAANKAAILAHHLQLKQAATGSPVGSPSQPRINYDDIIPLRDSPRSLAPEASASAQVRLRRMSVSIDRTAKNIADYNILDTLGEGAYGFVKLAERKDDENKEKVVIKFVIKSRILVHTWIRDRDLGVVPMEIHVLNYLRKNPHPCIVRIIDYWEDAEFFYIEMSLHGWGMDLFDYIEITENMTEADIKYIFHQIALAVQHLHRRGIVHRDIKDENVILDENLSIQLIDFGSSAYYREGKKFDTFCGTLDYASPEVLTGHKYDGPPQDIWALGILLYTMIYKENPFYNIDEIISHPLRVPFIMSPESLDLIRCMLQRDVGARPSIDEVLAHPWFRRTVSPGIHTPTAP